jgi:hypothetical protein
MHSRTSLVSSQTPPITELSVPNFGLKTALHRRGSTFYIVYSRAHGMLDGQKLYAQLNFPRATDAPASQYRFWHRESPTGDLKISFADLLGVKPVVFRDVGLSRLVKVDDQELEVQERLVEVILMEKKFCQRCAWCGQWETEYPRSTRYTEVDDRISARSLFWCGVSSHTRW